MTPTQIFLNLTDELICILDESGKVHDVNNNWKNLFKTKPKAGKAFLDLVHPDDKPAVSKFFETPTHVDLRLPECRVTDLDGKGYWVSLKMKRIPDQNRYWCLMRDITLRKNTFSILNQISDNCNLGHWEYDSIQREMKWSPKIFEIFEQDMETFRPTLENVRSLFAEADLKQIRQAILEQDEFEYTMTLDKKWLRFRGKKEVYPDGQYHVKGFLQDITRETLKDVIQLSSNVELSSFEKGLDQFSIVARTDARGRIIHANEEFCRISKYSHQELTGQDHRLLNSGHHPKSFFENMWEHIHSGRNWRGEIKNRAKDGTYYWVDTIIIPIRDNKGELKEILSFRFEITNLKKEQEVNQALRNKLELLIGAAPVGNWSYDFANHIMTWDDKMARLLEADSSPSFKFLIQSLDDFQQNEFEIFLKDPTRDVYQVEATLKEKRVFFRVKAFRNKQGVPIRIDGVCGHSSINFF